jgi:hypothetical protein
MAQPPAAGSSINRDLGFKLKPFVSIASIVGNNTSEGTGLACDLKGYEGAVALIHFGVSGDTLSGSVKALVSVQDSDNGTTNWADLATSKYRVDAALDVTTTAVWTLNTAFADIDAAAEDDVLYYVTLLPGAGIKRYVRALITFTGTHTNGTPISATFIKGFPRVEAAA